MQCVEKECERNEELQNFIEWVSKRKYVILSAWVITMMTWGYRMNNFVLCYDMEHPDFKRFFINSTMSFGRPVLAAIVSILPGKMLPFWEVFLFTTLLLMAGIIMLWTMYKITLKNMLYADLIFLGLFISMPSHYAIYVFADQSIAMSIGWLLITGGGVRVRDEHKRRS